LYHPVLGGFSCRSLPERRLCHFGKPSFRWSLPVTPRSTSRVSSRKSLIPFKNRREESGGSDDQPQFWGPRSYHNDFPRQALETTPSAAFRSAGQTD